VIAYKKVPTARPDTKTWYDLLGRTRQTATEGWANKTINSVVTYDALGRAKTKTLPFYTGDAAVLTTVAYNIYGGVQSETNNIGTTNYAYDYNPSNLLTISAATTLKTTVTNPMGQATSGVTDGSGKVKNTTDNKGIVTEMKYDSWGNPISTTVAGVEVVTMTYDDYGRQTTLADKNAGTTTYLYNSFGELVKQVTPKGTHTMEYDALGRIKTRNGTEGITSYTYVSSGNGVNQVKTVTGFSGETKAFTYDTFGRTLTETDVIDGISFVNTYTYDQYSNLLTVKYPSDLLITREYDANGYLSTIKNGSTTIFENTSKNALGQYTAYTLGGNQAVEKTYNQYGVPTNFKANSGVIQNLSFDFELKTGNLTRRTDHRKGKFEHFTYDDINRLTSAQIGNIGAALSGELQNYTFADNGNIMSKTGIGAYKYDPVKLHAVVEVENTTLAIPTISQFITYSAFQQPMTITEGTNVLTYTYSADYQRIKGVISSSTGAAVNKRYYFGDFERDITGGVTRDIHYVGADGLNCIIEKVGTNVSYYYVYKDYLGSILTVTNATGSIVEEKNYDAWGKNRNTNDWTYNNIAANSLSWMTRGYTGHEHLSQFGLINMNGRLYDPILGRMLSPDNYTHEGSQGYNRYSYAMNNPLKYSDPDGQNPILLGFAIGAAFDIGVQLYSNGGNFGEIDWYSVGVSGFAGAVGGSIAQAIGSSAKIAKAFESISNLATRAFAQGALSGALSEAGSSFFRGLMEGQKGIELIKTVASGMFLGGITGGFFEYAKYKNAKSPFIVTPEPEIGPISAPDGSGTSFNYHESEFPSIDGSSDLGHKYLSISAEQEHPLDKTIGLGIDDDLYNHRGKAIIWKDAGWQRAKLTKVDWGRAYMDKFYFQDSFREACENANYIRFDVTSFDPFYPKSGMTSFEFNHILKNQHLLSKTIFLQDNMPVRWTGTLFKPLH
jgi:RHS repeat-associated protein